MMKFWVKGKPQSPVGNEPLFKAVLFSGGGHWIPEDVRFYENYFELWGWRKATRFDYSQISRVEEVMVMWGRGMQALAGRVFMTDGRKPLVVPLAPRPRGMTFGFRKMDSKLDVDLPTWLEQKLGNDRYIRRPVHTG